MGRFTAPLALAALIALGCGDTIAATQVMAVIDAQPGVRSMTEKVHVLVRGGTGKESSWTVRHDAVVTSGGLIAWPLEVALIPKGDDSERVYEVVATALDRDDNAVARVRAISGYVKGKTRALRLLFEDSCIGKADLCGMGETCSGGSCEDAHVDPASLEQFRPGGSTGATAMDAGIDSVHRDASPSGIDSGPGLGTDGAMNHRDGGTPTTDGATEVDAGPPSCVAQVAAGTCALKGDGTVWCWGSNASGEVGNGTLNSPVLQPYNVAALGSDVVKIGRSADPNYAFMNAACALKADGTVWCWGNNSAGIVGDGTTSGEACTTCTGGSNCRTSPAWVKALGNDVSDLAVGGPNIAFAIKKDGTLWRWGSGGTDACAGCYAASSYCALSPFQVTALSKDVEKITAGSGWCAIKKDGTLWCQRLYPGDGTVQSTSPVWVAALGSSVSEVALGWMHTCAIKTDGTLWCWGDNQFGQLGLGTKDDELLPQQVVALGDQASHVSAGGFGTTCAVRTDHTLWCWGNTYGSFLSSTMPMQVTSLGSEVASVSVGRTSNCAIKTDGTLWCWGENVDGELGDGTATGETCGTPPDDVICHEEPIRASALLCP